METQKNKLLDNKTMLVGHLVNLLNECRRIESQSYFTPQAIQSSGFCLESKIFKHIILTNMSVCCVVLMQVKSRQKALPGI